MPQRNGKNRLAPRPAAAPDISKRLKSYFPLKATVGSHRCFGSFLLFLTPPCLHQKACKVFQVTCLPGAKWAWNNLKIKRYQCFFLKTSKTIQEQKERRKTASWLIKKTPKYKKKRRNREEKKRIKGGKKKKQEEQPLPTPQGHRRYSLAFSVRANCPATNHDSAVTAARAPICKKGAVACRAQEQERKMWLKTPQHLENSLISQVLFPGGFCSVPTSASSCSCSGLCFFQILPLPLAF